MRILITGGGVIGAHTSALLLENNQDVALLEINPQYDSIYNIIGKSQVKILREDILDLNKLIEVVKDNNIDSIVHTVANPMLNAGANDNPYDAIKLNIMGTANVLETMRKCDLNRLIFLSSATLTTNLKPALEIGSLSEDNIPRTTNIYSSTKISCENLGLNYSNIYGVDFVALRPVGVFGPWAGKGGGGRSNMMKQLIEDLINGKNGYISPWIGEILYVKDMAWAIFNSLSSNKIKSRIYNIGMGEIYKPEEVINIIKGIFPEATISLKSSGEMLKFKPSNPVEKPLDLKRSREELSYVPKYPMKKAIEDYVNWRKSFLGNNQNF